MSASTCRRAGRNGCRPSSRNTTWRPTWRPPSRSKPNRTSPVSSLVDLTRTCEGIPMHDDWTNADLAALRGQTAFTRREILVTSLAAGFALATQPVSAQTITTDTDGLTAGEVKIPVSDGEIPGYRAMPAKGRHFPVVLVVQEIFGVHEHIRDLCRRFAKAGYLAIAPELYARQGDVSNLKDIQ